MAIETVSGIVKALGNNFSRLVIDKASISNAVAGQPYSLWRATGQLDEVAIYNTALTQSDIGLLYNSGNGITL